MDILRGYPLDNISNIVYNNNMKRKRTDLSPQEQRVWDFILGFEVDSGRTPSNADIALNENVSRVRAWGITKQLAKKGWIFTTGEYRNNIKIIEGK